MPAEQDLYQVLGVSKTASAAQIKAAYVQLALENHPDKYRGTDSKETVTERFITIQEAYETLSDPVTRAAYDRNKYSYQKNAPKPRATPEPSAKPKPSATPKPSSTYGNSYSGGYTGGNSSSWGGYTGSSYTGGNTGYTGGSSYTYSSYTYKTHEETKAEENAARQTRYARKGI